MPLHKPGSAAFGLLSGAAGHAGRWPIAKGGSQNIAAAVQKYFVALGGEVKTGMEIHSLEELPQARVVLLDVTPRQLAGMSGTKLSGSRDSISCLNSVLDQEYPNGLGIGRPCPLGTNGMPACPAIVHVGGTFAEIAGAEDEVWQGQHPENPFVHTGTTESF